MGVGQVVPERAELLDGAIAVPAGGDLEVLAPLRILEKDLRLVAELETVDQAGGLLPVCGPRRVKTMVSARSSTSRDRAR